MLSRPWKADRASARSQLGRLSERVVAWTTRQRYEKTCQWFFLWLRHWQHQLPADAHDLDDLVAQAIDQAWEEGEIRNLIGDLLSGLALFIPKLKGQLNFSWRLWAAWGRQLGNGPSRASKFLPGLEVVSSGIAKGQLRPLARLPCDPLNYRSA